MITPTAIHPGFINEAMEAAASTPRWRELSACVADWSMPEDERQEALRRLRGMELDAWAQAGRKYRLALAAYEAHVALRWRGTAITYGEPPRPPIALHFGP